MITQGQIIAQLGANQPLAHHLYLKLPDLVLKIQSNSGELIASLEHYFSHIVCPPASADICVQAVESKAVELPLTFKDWPREAGKSGRKDAYYDGAQQPGENWRVIHKVRTGMLFLQSTDHAIAAGPCVANDNQVINFICSQYLTYLQQQNWLNCHAAALHFQDKGIAFAGFSGGGKSTLMLHMLENEQTSYVTNDRLLVKQHKQHTQARGIPKLPRINPGTIVNSQRLQPLISEQERAVLLALPPEQLWDLEQKYDVLINDIYGKGRIQHHTSLHMLVILNWQRQGQTPCQLQQIDIAQRPDLLAAVMKSSGPFYQDPDGKFYSPDSAPVPEAYLQALQGVTVYEATGKVDFATLSEQCFAALAAS